MTSVQQQENVAVRYVARIFYDMGTERVYNGTAFVVHPGGYFATCWHVVEKAGDSQIFAQLPYSPPMRCEILDRDEVDDIALLKTEVDPLIDPTCAAVLTDIQLANHFAETITLWGYSNYRNTPTAHAIPCAISAPVPEFGLYEFNGDIHHGDSGGPIVRGERVIGIALLKDKDLNGIGYFRPVTALVKLLVKNGIFLGPSDGDGRGEQRTLNIRELVHSPSVQPLVLHSKQQFEAADHLITVLRQCKKMHDLLQQIQLCYERIAIELQNNPKDPFMHDRMRNIGWDLSSYSETVFNITRDGDLRKTVDQAGFRSYDPAAALIDNVSVAYDRLSEIDCMLKNVVMISLERRIPVYVEAQSSLLRLLQTSPTYFNQCMITVVKDLNFEALIGAMDQIYSAMVAEGADQELIGRFFDIPGFEQLKKGVVATLHIHDRLQDLESNLNRVQENYPEIMDSIVRNNKYIGDNIQKLRNVTNNIDRDNIESDLLNYLLLDHTGVSRGEKILEDYSIMSTAVFAEDERVSIERFISLRHRIQHWLQLVDLKFITHCERLIQVKYKLQALVESL